MSEEKLDQVPASNHMITQPATIGNIHTYFLDENIGEASQYRDLSLLLMTAPEQDTVRLMINGPGGYLTTAVQLCNLIQSCDALVEAHILGDALSAQGMIALACDSWYTYPTSRVMLHTYRGGVYGKAPEIRQSVEADTIQINTFLRDLATHFCTEQELYDMIEHGKDIWLQGEDLTNRLGALHEQRMLAEKQMELEILDAQKAAIEAAIAERNPAPAMEINQGTGDAEFNKINAGVAVDSARLDPRYIK